MIKSKPRCKKVSKRVTKTRKPTTKRKISARRKNPESLYRIGYEEGVYDIAEKQFDPNVLGEGYINLLGTLLSKEPYSSEFDKFHEYVRGYLNAGLEKGVLKRSDVPRVQKYIDSVKEDPSLLFLEFPKMIWIINEYLGGEATLEDLVKARSEKKAYVEFIIEGLVELGYVEKVGRKYKLTTKGARSLPFIVHANKISKPDHFADVERYLKHG